MHANLKCGCGTPLHPQYAQEEAPGRIVVTPVPPHVDPNALPRDGSRDPLAWGATPEDVWAWLNPGGQPQHDIVDRHGRRQITGTCRPDVPAPLAPSRMSIVLVNEAGVEEDLGRFFSRPEWVPGKRNLPVEMGQTAYDRLLAQLTPEERAAEAARVARFNALETAALQQLLQHTLLPPDLWDPPEMLADNVAYPPHPPQEPRDGET